MCLWGLNGGLGRINGGWMSDVSDEISLVTGVSFKNLGNMHSKDEFILIKLISYQFQIY